MSLTHDMHFSTGYMYMYDKYVNLQALPQVEDGRVSSLNLSVMEQCMF